MSNAESVGAFAELKRYGLLLQTDAHFPNVSALVAGEAVRGSWWSHPRGREIFRVNGELADRSDVLLTKLISRKLTYVHRQLWRPVIAIAHAREPWQMEGLSQEAKKLLAKVDRKPVEPEGMSKPAAELETKLLVYSEQFHTESGAHVRRLESWDHWSGRIGYAERQMSVAQAKLALEEVVASLNRKFAANGVLPWQGKS